MTDLEPYKAQNTGEPGTPQAPEMGAPPETPPVEGTPPETSPEKTPEQLAKEGEAEYRRKYQESEGKVGLLQQQMNFTQQQLTQLQQAQIQPKSAAQQIEEMPEFEDPQQALKWIREDNARQRKIEMDSLRNEFKETTLKSERERVAERVIGSYPALSDQSSPLYQQFTQKCYQRGINPQTADPFTLESVAAISAQELGILPQNTQQSRQPNNPLPQGRPPGTWNGERIPHGAAPRTPTVTLTPDQKANCAAFGQTEAELKAYILKKNYRLADGSQAYNVK